LDDAPEVAKMAGPDYSDLTDLMLEIRQLCQSELEHDVVSLRSRGLADVEIAEVVGVVRQTVANAANRVEARYEASLDIGA
jgi:orotate phosphoribosyltransferase-like protein